MTEIAPSNEHPTLTFAPATMNDLDDLLKLRNEALQRKLDKSDNSWGVEPFTSQEIISAIERGNTHILRLYGQPAASVELSWEDERNWDKKGSDGQAGYIHALVVGAAYSGQKLGDRIMELCGAIVQSTGRTKVRLDCAGNNEKLCAYYENLGFHKFGITDRGNALFERNLEHIRSDA